MIEKRLRDLRYGVLVFVVVALAAAVWLAMKPAPLPTSAAEAACRNQVATALASWLQVNVTNVELGDTDATVSGEVVYADGSRGVFECALTRESSDRWDVAATSIE